MMAIYFSGMALAAFALVASVQAEAFDIPAGASKTLIFATALMMITAWPILFVYVFGKLCAQGSRGATMDNVPEHERPMSAVFGEMAKAYCEASARARRFETFKTSELERRKRS